MLRTFENNSCNLPLIIPFLSFIGAALWAIRSTYHMALQATPGQLVCGRDTLLSIQFRADWRLKSKSENKDSLTKAFFTKTPREYDTNTRSVTKYCSLNLAYCINPLSQEREHIS
jgi:hypothetical protein